MGLFNRRNDKELARLAAEGRANGMYAEAMAVLPPDVRKAIHEAERKAEKGKR